MVVAWEDDVDEDDEEDDDVNGDESVSFCLLLPLSETDTGAWIWLDDELPDEEEVEEGEEEEEVRVWRVVGIGLNPVRPAYEDKDDGIHEADEESLKLILT